ncbi:LysR family transcriptional regulator [Pseudidiomarina salinarum]|uniref:LysR family transcriptional regulator n=1 Tax=Pseudidiomarina salinarum TaxID=435908 RepID=A0A094IVW3_9GAMM|nr:LysR family transcriptional regulator [Pseudidiomarina salinarum]KFZ31267.1 LysR family transcriptional regulator [Pseudidiomarina salinarum]RUO70983.1 LysR family transcriptional regulator [Pseudidiomarina salinarum]
MKIQQLQMLDALADTGSLQGAADKLHRTQAAVSMALKKLEQDAGFPLFDRDTYRLGLTTRGEQFLRQAREVLRQQQRLQSLTLQLQSGAEPQLRISYDHTCSPSLLFAAMRQVQQNYPATELLLSGESQLKSLRSVSSGDADLALCPWLPIFRQHGDFETRLVRPFELLVVIAPELVERYGGMPRQRHELLDLPMLIPQDQDIGINLDRMIRMPGQQRIRVNDSIAQRELLLAGMGWGICPGDLVNEAVARGALLQIEIPGFINEVHLEVHLVRSAERIAGPAGQLIWGAFAHSPDLS